MRNKVLVVDANPDERAELEQILQDVVDAGGEIFFAERREDGIAIMKKEHPQLVFLDSSLVGENEDEWVYGGVHIVVMRFKNEPHQKSEDFVLKPLKAHQVLEKSRMILSQEHAPQIPPM